MKKNNTLNNCFLSDCSTSDSRAVLGGITLQIMLAGIILTASNYLWMPACGIGAERRLPGEALSVHLWYSA
jgi:hypothetical protein